MAARPVAVTPWLRALEHARKVAHRGVDPEGVHELRVALARIRLWLRLAHHRTLRDDTRWLRSAAAPLRDVDVRLSLHPPPAEARRLARRRVTERRKLREQLDAPRTHALLTALARLPPVRRKAARRQLDRLAARVLEAGERVERHPHDLDALHALRVAARRLRYGLDYLGQRSGPVAALQESLGEACDCAITLGRRHRAGPFERELIERRRIAERKARKQWYALRPELAGQRAVREG